MKKNMMNAEAEVKTVAEVTVVLSGRDAVQAKIDAFVALKNDKEAKAEEVNKAEEAMKEELKTFNAGVRSNAYKALTDVKDMLTKKSFDGILKIKNEDGDDGFSASLVDSSELYSLARIGKYKNLVLNNPKAFADKLDVLVKTLNAAFAAETEVGELSDEFKKVFKGEAVETVSTNKLTSALQDAFDMVIYDKGTRDDGKNSYQAKKADARLLKAGAFDFKDKAGKFVPATSKRVVNLLTLLLTRTVGGNPIEVIKK